VVFLVLSAWLIAETQHGSALGLTERLVSGIQITWPFIVALALSRQQEPRTPTASGSAATQHVANATAAQQRPARRGR
jgi:hypothetical protein